MPVPPRRLRGAPTFWQAADPQQVLARGYAVLTDHEGTPITSIDKLAVGATVSAHVADGTAEPATLAVERTSR